MRVKLQIYRASSFRKKCTPDDKFFATWPSSTSCNTCNKMLRKKLGCHFKHAYSYNFQTLTLQIHPALWILFPKKSFWKWVFKLNRLSCVSLYLLFYLYMCHCVYTLIFSNNHLFFQSNVKQVFRFYPRSEHLWQHFRSWNCFYVLVSFICGVGSEAMPWLIINYYQ